MSQSQTKEQVAIFYEEFQKRGKYDYLYGGDDRKNLIVRLIGKGKSILEVGCRAGNLTQHYAEGNRVVGVDIDRNALKLFEERLGLSGHWLDLDSERLPFDSNSFDLVVFSEVMEHLRFPQSALAEIHRVLRPEGSLVGSVPNAFRPAEYRQLLGMHVDDFIDVEPNWLLHFASAANVSRYSCIT